MALNATKSRCFAPPEIYPHARHIDSPPEYNCMPKSRTIIPRKRARLEQHTGQPSEASLPTKRKKASLPSEPPPAYWDNLSKIWLTKGALVELDRRNTQATQSTTRALRKKSHVASEQEVASRFCRHDPRTLKALQTFSRHGGPDLSDLRSFCITNRTMSSSRSGTRRRQRDSASASTRLTTSTTRTKSTGVYDRDFQQHLVDHKVYPHGYRHSNGSAPAKPTNWNDINGILGQPRPSLSPPIFGEEDYEKFMQADADASKEKQVSELVMPFLEGRIEDAKCRSGGIPFTNLDPLTDGTLKPGNPDIYYGARPEQLSRQVRTRLGSQIIPSTQHDLPMVPNFFLAAKGPDGSIAVAGRQACYDGALGARGMASLEQYGTGELGYGATSTISSIYHGGTLKMYTNHLMRPSSPEGPPEYCMTQINTWGMTGNANTFREGAKAYRNARDWAKTKRDELIRQANDKAALEETVTTIDEVDASPALSFVTAASDTEVHTMSQGSRTTLNESSNALGIFEESDSSIETFADARVAAQQSNKRKRRSTNAQGDAQRREN